MSFCALSVCRDCDGGLVSRGAAIRDAVWNTRVLRVAFLGDETRAGELALRQQVRQFAHLWHADSGARFEFLFDNQPEQAHIRVALRAGYSASELGRYARKVEDPHVPTLHLNVTPSSSESTIRRETLHEFGHALGLVHEHQVPASGIEWEEEEVFEDFARIGWSESLVRSQIIDVYNSSEINASAFDSKSGMIYRIKKNWTKNKLSFKRNTVLSDGDKAFIRTLYP